MKSTVVDESLSTNATIVLFQRKTTSLFHDFFIVSQVAVNTTFPPVVVVCTGALTPARPGTIAPTSVEVAAALGQHDWVLPAPLILRHTVRGVVGLSHWAEPPTNLYILVFIMVFTFYFQVLIWLPFSPMGTQPLGFSPLQPFGVYPWQAYVTPAVC